MRNIRSVLRNVDNYLMWHTICARVMSAILLAADGWLTSAIWLVRSLLRYRHPNIILVLTSLFMCNWCLLPCGPAFEIHCTDILLVSTRVFSICSRRIIWWGWRDGSICGGLGNIVIGWFVPYSSSPFTLYNILHFCWILFSESSLIGGGGIFAHIPFSVQHADEFCVRQSKNMEMVKNRPNFKANVLYKYITTFRLILTILNFVTSDLISL